MRKLKYGRISNLSKSHSGRVRIWTEAVWSLVAQMVKNLPIMQETQVWFLGWEGPLEKGMAIHSSILAWRIPWTEEPGGLQSMAWQRVRHNWAPNTFTFSLIPEPSFPKHSGYKHISGIRQPDLVSWLPEVVAVKPCASCLHFLNFIYLSVNGNIKAIFISVSWELN